MKTLISAPSIEGDTEHAIYWSAGGNFWGATVDP